MRVPATERVVDPGQRASAAALRMHSLEEDTRALIVFVLEQDVGFVLTYACKGFCGTDTR